jgi:7,8-dihydropterin-6-yl-methyl-4-(beta-D-ribofuranosyl)aminobenzene 5'-phosphate synthase
MLIQFNDKKILFDTGQTDAFALNADEDNIDLSLINYIVISHGHYDHTGGLKEICKRNKQAKIIIHNGAIIDRFNAKNGKPVRDNIGVPWNLHDKEFQDRIVYSNTYNELCENIFISGEIPRVYDDIDNKFVYCDDDGNYIKDNIMDEQFIAIRGNKGIYIFSGCSHSGARNIIKYTKELFPGEKIRAFIGGLHLSKSSYEDVNNTIKILKNENIDITIPLHCTGIVPSCKIKEILKDKCVLLNTGDEYTFE